jgi:hypothetical protein
MHAISKSSQYLQHCTRPNSDEASKPSIIFDQPLRFSPKRLLFVPFCPSQRYLAFPIHDTTIYNGISHVRSSICHLLYHAWQAKGRHSCCYSQCLYLFSKRLFAGLNTTTSGTQSLSSTAFYLNSYLIIYTVPRTK